mgnify:FL=1
MCVNDALVCTRCEHTTDWRVEGVRFHMNLTPAWRLQAADKHGNIHRQKTGKMPTETRLTRRCK